MIDTEDKTLSDISELLIATDVKKLGEATVLPDTDERKAKQLPDPSGYRLLCGIPEVDRVTDGGIIKADVTVHHEELLATVLFVIKVGPDAYRDTARFPNGPWCTKGDFIVVRPHAGSRLKIHGREFRIINDDAVEAVVEDPRGISRA